MEMQLGRAHPGICSFACMIMQPAGSEDPVC
jgi:hypothetical protein